MNEQIKKIADELDRWDNLNEMTLDAMKLRLIELRVDRDNYCRGYLKALRDLAEERELITKLYSELADLRKASEIATRIMLKAYTPEELGDKYSISLYYIDGIKSGTKKPEPYEYVRWARILEKDYDTKQIQCEEG